MRYSVEPCLSPEGMKMLERLVENSKSVAINTESLASEMEELVDVGKVQAGVMSIAEYKAKKAYEAAANEFEDFLEVFYLDLDAEAKWANKEADKLQQKKDEAYREWKRIEDEQG